MLERNEAIRLILVAANKSRGVKNNLTRFSHRTIQQAVHKVRNLNLVKEDVLVAAGFKPRGSNYRKPKDDTK